MATLREYFEREARDALAEVERQLADAAGPDAGEMYRAIRALRGAAQMARDEAVRGAASIMEAAARALMDGGLQWSPEQADRTRATLDDLHALIREGAGPAAAARASRVEERWRDAGVRPRGSAPAASDRTADGMSAGGADREFREYAAGEMEGIAEALQSAVHRLAADPMDRDALLGVLRQQRALLGAARLDELPVVPEILRAVEDLTRVIAKLDVGVKHEWLDVYRIAFEALRAGITPLRSGGDPLETNALKRLRHMRQELLERYGAGEAVAASQPGEPVQAQPLESPAVSPAPDYGGFAGVVPFLPPRPVAEEILELSDEQVVEDPDFAGVEVPPHSTGQDGRAGGAEDVAAPEDDIVAIEELLYRGDAAVQRANELRDAIAAACADGHVVEAVEELVDLVRQGAG
jgi:chemotaxis protein histidine kinase CheA